MFSKLKEPLNNTIHLANSQSTMSTGQTRNPGKSIEQTLTSQSANGSRLQSQPRRSSSSRNVGVALPQRVQSSKGKPKAAAEKGEVDRFKVAELRAENKQLRGEFY